MKKILKTTVTVEFDGTETDLAATVLALVAQHRGNNKPETSEPEPDSDPEPEPTPKSASAQGEKSKRTRTTHRSESAAEKPAPEPEAEATNAADCKGVTRDDLRELMSEVFNEVPSARAEVVKWMRDEYGAKNVSEVSDADLPEFYARVNALIPS